MNHGILEDIHWLIEAKVWLSGESSNSFISYIPGTGKSAFAKKRCAKRLKLSVTNVPDGLVMQHVVL